MKKETNQHIIKETCERYIKLSWPFLNVGLKPILNEICWILLKHFPTRKRDLSCVFLISSCRVVSFGIRAMVFAWTTAKGTRSKKSMRMEENVDSEGENCKKHLEVLHKHKELIVGMNLKYNLLTSKIFSNNTDHADSLMNVWDNSSKSRLTQTIYSKTDYPDLWWLSWRMGMQVRTSFQLQARGWDSQGAASYNSLKSTGQCGGINGFWRQLKSYLGRNLYKLFVSDSVELHIKMSYASWWTLARWDNQNVFEGLANRMQVLL